MKHITELFDLKLILTSLLALVLIILIGEFVPLDWTLTVLGSGLVYCFGLAKKLLPGLIEKQIKNKCVQLPGEIASQIDFRLNQLEDRVDRLSQIIFKVEAAIKVSPLDEFLENERLNNKAIAELKLTIDDLRSEIDDLRSEIATTDRLESC